MRRDKNVVLMMSFQGPGRVPNGVLRQRKKMSVRMATRHARKKFTAFVTLVLRHSTEVLRTPPQPLLCASDATRAAPRSMLDWALLVDQRRFPSLEHQRRVSG